MKSYWSIPGVGKDYRGRCYMFVKYDGSNLRFLWTEKNGWCRFGTREKLFDQSHPIYGRAIPLFLNKYGKELETVFRTDKNLRKAKEVIVFGEFFGKKSFAGMHFPDDQYDIVMFDVCPHKQGIMSPSAFLDCFGHMDVAEVIQVGILTDEVIEEVRSGKLDIESHYKIRTVIPEGVICKGGSRHHLWMAKIKTDEYREELKKRFRNNWEQYWET